MISEEGCQRILQHSHSLKILTKLIDSLGLDEAGEKIFVMALAPLTFETLITSNCNIMILNDMPVYSILSVLLYYVQVEV